MTYVPEATRLRNAGLLWPENLSDEALEQELGAARSNTQPISVRMLREEDDRRRRGLRIGADYWRDFDPPHPDRLCRDTKVRIGDCRCSRHRKG